MEGSEPKELIFLQAVRHANDVLPASETCSNRCIAGGSIWAVLHRGKFDDAQLSTFLEHLPPQLRVLRALARDVGCCRMLPQALKLVERCCKPSSQAVPLRFVQSSWRPGITWEGEPGCSIPSLRLGPGLHSRGMRAVGRAAVGTAGALLAHSQDTSAPGEGWEVSQKLESLKPIMWDPTLWL